MRISPRFIATLAVAALAVALTAACGSDPTPTPTPTPAPTPTPTPLPPIAIDSSDAWRDVASELSPDETSCIRGRLGDEVYEELLDKPALAQDAGLASLPIDCLEQKNAIALFVARIDAQAGGLAPESESCLRETLADTDIGLLTNAVNDPDSVSAPSLGNAVGLAYCLNDEEAAAVSVGDLIGEPSLDFTVAQFTCIADRVDIAALLAPPDASAAGDAAEFNPLALLQALSECGVDLSAFGGDAAP